MSLYNVKQYNFNMITAEMDWHFVANAKPFHEAHDIMMGAMNMFSDKGWYINQVKEEMIEVVKGDERIKVILRKIQ